MEPIGNIVCDLDGVVYLGDEAIPGAGPALTTLEERGYRILLVTNNSTRRKSEVAARVTALSGYEATESSVLSSGMATARMLVGTVDRVFIVGEQGLTETMHDEGIETTNDWRKAGAVVVGLDRHVTYEALRRGTQAVRNGARLVATNLDPTYPTPEGFWPGGGAIVAAIATAAGVEPEVGGKPFPAMRKLIAQELGPGVTWVVGDRADTDLEIGKLEGWNRALVLSGATSADHGLTGIDVPELILGSIAELPGHVA